MSEYSPEVQQLYLEFLTSDDNLFVLCNPIIKTNYFHKSLRPTVTLIQDYVNKHGTVPDRSVIKAHTAVSLQGVDAPTVQSHRDWFLDAFEKFCRHKAIHTAILASTDKLEKGEYGSVEKLVKDAVQVGLVKDMGMDYWDDPLGRLQRIVNNKSDQSTGWKSIDRYLNGGLSRGELTLFAGPSGSGKSLFLQNLALNWSMAGSNVIYITLELSQDLCGMRMDAMVSDYAVKAMFKNMDDTAFKVQMAGKKAGKLQVVQFPNGITVHDIKSYLKTYQTQTGIMVDAIIVDYVDLMMPAGARVRLENLFVKDKLVSEELRNLAVEYNCYMVSASQLNRSAVDEPEYDHSHIAGGLSKIQTADNVIGIIANRTLRQQGRTQIQFMKTRSSNGVDFKVSLAFDIDTLRITDLPDDAEDNETMLATNMYAKLNKKNGDESSTPATQVNTNTDKIKDILRKTGMD